MHQFSQQYDLASDEILSLIRIAELYPRKTRMHFDVTRAEIYADIPFTDKFTFGIETDDLILSSTDFDTFAHALIEMAIYLSGFATKMGNSNTWVSDFTIGAWKPVKRDIKPQLQYLNFAQIKEQIVPSQELG